MTLRNHNGRCAKLLERPYFAYNLEIGELILRSTAQLSYYVQLFQRATQSIHFSRTRSRFVSSDRV